MIFGLSRFVSYFLWIEATVTAAQTLWDVLTLRVGRLVAVGVQIVGFLVLIVLVWVDWTRLLQRWSLL